MTNYCVIRVFNEKLLVSVHLCGKTEVNNWAQLTDPMKCRHEEILRRINVSI